MSKVGIIMGAGPTVSSYFYHKLNELSRNKYGFQPEFVMYNMTFSTEVENSFISKQADYDSYKTSLNKAVIFFSKNNIQKIAFPCFSLSPILKQICSRKAVEFIDPFESIEINSRDAIISVIDIREMFISNSEAIQYINANTIGLDKVILKIVNGVNPALFVTHLEKIEKELNSKGFRRIILACTELCMIDYANKISKVNLLNVLIEKTLSVVMNNNFG